MKIGSQDVKVFDLAAFIRGVRRVLQDNSKVIEQLRQSQVAMLEEIQILRRKVDELHNSRRRDQSH